MKNQTFCEKILPEYLRIIGLEQNDEKYPSLHNIDNTLQCQTIFPHVWEQRKKLMNMSISSLFLTLDLTEETIEQAKNSNVNMIFCVNDHIHNNGKTESLLKNMPVWAEHLTSVLGENGLSYRLAKKMIPDGNIMWGETGFNGGSLVIPIVETRKTGDEILKNVKKYSRHAKKTKGKHVSGIQNIAVIAGNGGVPQALVEGIHILLTGSISGNSKKSFLNEAAAKGISAITFGDNPGNEKKGIDGRRKSELIGFQETANEFREKMKKIGVKVILEQKM